jgi:hypothetical protein
MVVHLAGPLLWPICLLGGFVMTLIPIRRMGTKHGPAPVILHGDAA